jgi:hypothetical protein
MHWKTSRITIKRWEANGIRISETAEPTGRLFTLEDTNEPDQEPIGFSTLREAQVYGEILNERNVVRQDNDRLRAELAQARGIWPTTKELPSGHADETALEHGDEETPIGTRARKEVAVELTPTMAPKAHVIGSAEELNATAASLGTTPERLAARRKALAEQQAKRKTAEPIDDGRGIPPKPLAIAKVDVNDPWF